MSGASTSGTRSGFDVNTSSNSVQRHGGAVDFRTLIAGPARGATSLSGLGASMTTGVNGVAKLTSWEGDVWGGTLDGSDVSTLTFHPTPLAPQQVTKSD